MPITTCVFDAYGTLFDVAAAAREAAAEPGHDVFAEKWPAIARTWRLKQLQYTWLRATEGVHQDFWTVTQDGLDYALEEQGIDDADLRARLLQLYWELSAYPEVPGMLRALKDAGMATAILSNGTPDMLEGAVRAAGIGVGFGSVGPRGSVSTTAVRPHAANRTAAKSDRDRNARRGVRPSE